jgi:hypothetical protein
MNLFNSTPNIFIFNVSDDEDETYEFLKKRREGRGEEISPEKEERFKKVISDLSSIGLYYFKSSKDFLDYSKKMVNENIRTNNEFYVCPLYNLLINDGKKINTLLFDKCNSIGTPNEINEFILEKYK